jgi:membrane protein implicated in regulation of membrane protease activity
MFAIFLHESMNPFHQTVTSFPTLIYTVLLIICSLYWIVAVLGLVDLEILDLDMDGDIDAADSAEAQNGIAGVLLKLGLNGVPLTIVLTIIAIIGWILCYYAIYFGSAWIPSFWPLELAYELAIFVAVTYLTILLTAQVIKPIRTLFQKLESDETKHIVGQVIVVRSGMVNNDRGEGLMNDGGAGLLLQIRSTGTQEFVKGDEVVIIEENKERNLFRVIAKSEFSD